MPMSKSASNDEVLVTVAIELERLFTVLGNSYPKKKFPDQAIMIPKLEAAFRDCWSSVAREFSSNPPIVFPAS